MKKGFTLIELLAVVVILAIIALIAVPIILNTIDDAKVSSILRSADNYVDAVKLSVLEEISKNDVNFYPKKCIVNENGNLLCDNLDKEIVIEIDGEKPTSGEITFDYDDVSDVRLVFSGVSVITDNTGEIVYDEYRNNKVLQVDGVKYALDKIEEAIENSTIEKPVKLLENITLRNTCLIDADKDMSIDLNGKTITAENKDAIMLKGNNTSLTISNGTIKTSGSHSAITIGETAVDTSSVSKRQIIIKPNTNVIGEEYGVSAFGTSQVDLYGKIEITDSGYALSGNGRALNEGTVFNIYSGSKIIAPNGAALYLPQDGTTTISGGELSGYTAIGIKSGSLNITGGTFTSTGQVRIPQPQDNGIYLTGDVICIEQNLIYAGNIQINITGGTFESKKGGYIIQEYNPTSRTTSITGTYSTKNTVANTTNRFYYTN